jgi:fumarate reductase subunit C
MSVKDEREVRGAAYVGKQWWAEHAFHKVFVEHRSLAAAIVPFFRVISFNLIVIFIIFSLVSEQHTV